MIKTNFKKGDKLICVRYIPGLPYLTTNKKYTAIKDQEPGTFKTDPYITVTGDTGKPLTCHASRFELIRGDSKYKM